MPTGLPGRGFFPGAASRPAPGTATKSLVFPVWDLSKDFLRLAETIPVLTVLDSVCQMEGDPGFPRVALSLMHRSLPLWRVKIPASMDPHGPNPDS